MILIRLEGVCANVMKKNPFKCFSVILALFLGVQGSYAQSNCNAKQIFVEKACNGDTVGPDEKALFDLISQYRAKNGLPTATLSVQLSIVANRHLLDLRQNLKTLTHSWSNCPYDIRYQKTWPCSSDSPSRLGTSYKGEGYETLYRTSTGTASPALAIEAWKKSTLHNSIILNLDSFKDLSWDEIGVAIDGQFAALWFGSPKATGTKLEGGNGLGVTYGEAVKGLSKLLAIEKSSSTVEGGKWQGLSSDKKIKVEIYGIPSEIAEANVRVSVKLEADGKLSTKNYTVLSTLLKNLLPDWAEREVWLQKTLITLGTEKAAIRTQIVRKIAVEMKNGTGNSIDLAVRPVSKAGAKEIF